MSLCKFPLKINDHHQDHDHHHDDDDHDHERDSHDHDDDHDDGDDGDDEEDENGYVDEDEYEYVNNEEREEEQEDGDDRKEEDKNKDGQEDDGYGFIPEGIGEDMGEIEKEFKYFTRLHFYDNITVNKSATRTWCKTGMKIHVNGNNWQKEGLLLDFDEREGTCDVGLNTGDIVR